MKQEKALALVAELLAKVKGASQMKGVLVDLMTPAELQDVAERILICRALKTGTSQRAIAQSL
jgi:Trp operon repressor